MMRLAMEGQLVTIHPESAMIVLFSPVNYGLQELKHHINHELDTLPVGESRS